MRTQKLLAATSASLSLFALGALGPMAPKLGLILALSLIPNQNVDLQVAGFQFLFGAIPALIVGAGFGFGALGLIGL